MTTYVATRNRLGGLCSQEEVKTWKALIAPIAAAAALPNTMERES